VIVVRRRRLSKYSFLSSFPFGIFNGVTIGIFNGVTIGIFKAVTRLLEIGAGSEAAMGTIAFSLLIS